MASVSPIWFHTVLPLCISVKLQLTRLYVCLQPGSGHWVSVRTFGRRKIGCEEIWGKGREHVRANVRFRLTCQGSLCPRQLKYPARDFPSRRVCFLCKKTQTFCYSFKLAAKTSAVRLSKILEGLMRPKAAFDSRPAAETLRNCKHMTSHLNK